MPTKPTQMRLTDRDKLFLDAIMATQKLPDRTSTVRYLIQFWADSVNEYSRKLVEERARKKSSVAT